MKMSTEKYINPFTDFGFKKLFVTEVKMNKKEIAEYEDSLKKYRDLNSAIETAKMEGEMKGKIESIIKTALKMLEDGMSIENICKYTDLSEKQVKELINRDIKIYNK